MCDHCGCRDLTTVGRLMNEHDRLRELGDHIRRHLDRGDFSAAREHFREVLVVLGPHVAKEEGSLFPMLRREGSLAEHVTMLADEHAGLYDAVDDLDDVPAEALADWRDGVLRVLSDLDEHMYKEDFGLFPAALATLAGDDWDDVDRWEREHLGTSATL